MQPKNIIHLAILALLTLFLYGCSTGYKNEGDAVYYKCWNENSGQLKYKLDANPKTFQIFNDSYAKDDKSVFFRREKITGADAKTFVALSESYAKDKNIVWIRNDTLKGADANTFELIPKSEYCYTKDKQNIYYNGNIINGADLNSFQVVDEDNSVSKDKNNYYYSEYKIPIKDYSTFEHIKGDYWKDQYHVYDISNVFYLYNGYNNESVILEGVDPKTVKPVWMRNNCIKDKYGCYGWGKRIPCD